MGRFIFNDNRNKKLKTLNEQGLRQPQADWDTQPLGDDRYVETHAGFQPGKPLVKNVTPMQAEPSNKMQYLKAEIDYMVNGFMRELIDYQAFDNLDPDIQSEIRARYPQFFN